MSLYEKFYNNTSLKIKHLDYCYISLSPGNWTFTFFSILFTEHSLFLLILISQRFLIILLYYLVLVTLYKFILSYLLILYVFIYLSIGIFCLLLP